MGRVWRGLQYGSVRHGVGRKWNCLVRFAARSPMVRLSPVRLAVSMWCGLRFREEGRADVCYVKVQCGLR